MKLAKHFILRHLCAGTPFERQFAEANIDELTRFSTYYEIALQLRHCLRPSSIDAGNLDTLHRTTATISKRFDRELRTISAALNRAAK